MKRPLSTAGDPLIGSTIGSYIVQRLVGQGGMGTVYEVCHPKIGKRLALKLLHTEHAHKPDIVQRFFDEARAVNLIGHPNIVDIIDFNQLPDGRSYIMMEYLDGETLCDYLRRQGALSLDDVRDIALPICSALAAAHQVGITHRDLKPDNVHLIPHPDGGRGVKVLDFGIAKLSDEHRLDPRSASTRDGVVMGTPIYMSPEQAMGKSREIDARTDIYAFGIMLYEMLAGHVPFSSESFAALIISHLQERPQPLRGSRPDLSEDWEALVERALQKRPDQRFQSMTELSAAIEEAARLQPAARRLPTAPVMLPSMPAVAGKGPITTITSGQPAVRSGGRSRLALPLGIAAILAITTAIVLTILADRDNDETTTPARGVAATAPPATDAAPTPLPVPVAVAADAAPVAPIDAAPGPESSSDRRRRKERERQREERERRQREEEAAILADQSDGGTAEPPEHKSDGDGDGDKTAGSLKVTAEPWANVKVDSTNHGQTPIEIDLLPGRHRIVLTNRELGTRKTETVKIEPGRRREISVDMRAE